VTQCKTTKFVPRHDGLNSGTGESLFFYFIKNQIHSPINHNLPEMANAVICPETGKSLKHQELITKLRHKIKWMRSTANEINRLYNTNTIRFIRRSDVPKGQKVTYGSFVVDIKDHKE
jgi:hypothetical protein